MLGQLTSIGTLLAFVIVCAGVWALRIKRPDLPRPFKAPLVPLVPILGIGISLGLMISLPWSTWLRLIVWLVAGMAFILATAAAATVCAPALRSNLSGETYQVMAKYLMDK